jgi:hypothetical protein
MLSLSTINWGSAGFVFHTIIWLILVYIIAVSVKYFSKGGDKNESKDSKKIMHH